jgi:hypothetical protein
LLTVALLVGSLTSLSHAGQKQQTDAVAKPLSIAGALLQKQKDAWQPVKTGASLPPETWLVALPKSVLESANGAVRLHMEADIGKQGPYPVLETAVQLLKAKGADLEVRFDRGIIVLKNNKKKGAAKVRLHVREEVWTFTLKEPDSAIGLEVYSRHAPGLPLLTEGKVPDPVTYVMMLTLKGKVELKAAGQHYLLDAPPGNARAQWNSVEDVVHVSFAKELPKALMHVEKKNEELFKQLCTCAEHLHGKDIGPVLDEFLVSDSKVDRLVGVTAAGAVDDLGRVLKALANPKHADLRDHSVLVLRHWMGRQPGQVKVLLKALMDENKYTLAQARTIIQLLFGFNTEDRFNPSTYDLLINYLNHSQVAVRELAHWHLVRLVPEGEPIPFNAAAAEGDRQKSIAAWRQLIPEGKLPQPKAANNP